MNHRTVGWQQPVYQVNATHWYIVLSNSEWLLNRNVRSTLDSAHCLLHWLMGKVVTGHHYRIVTPLHCVYLPITDKSMYPIPFFFLVPCSPSVLHELHWFDFPGLCPLLLGFGPQGSWVKLQLVNKSLKKSLWCFGFEFFWMTSCNLQPDCLMEDH